MLKAGTILTDLYKSILPEAKDRRIADLRIGLGYTGVRLDNGCTGIAAVLFDALPHGCTVMPAAGSFAGSSAADLLQYLVDGKNPLEIAIGLAVANALIKAPADCADNNEATTYLNLKSGEKVAMVGLFAPLVERIRSTGATLTIVEKNPQRLELLSEEDKLKALKDCNVAIITATTLLNNTFEETVSYLGKPRSVALLGPSTPLLPEIFRGSPVTHLGGAAVADSAKVLQIISEGGGTPALRPYLRFVNIFCKK
ncbi:MAG: DUF364 domain-containing protein [Smithella sp.]|jgi:uncharacterized protein (DUF4213/DUF364 family)